MFINIKTRNGSTVWVNPDHIAAVFDEETNYGCYIQLSNGTEIACNETADEMTDYIIDKISIRG